QLKVSNFDRYYLLALAAFILLCAPMCSKFSSKLLVIGLILNSCFAVYGTIACMDVMNFNRAQSMATQRLLNEGIRAEAIDGGPAFVLPIGGKIFSSTFKQGVGWPDSMRGKGERCKLRWWPILGENYIISTREIKDYKVVHRDYYWSPLRWRRQAILTLQIAKAED
ncbi:MAG: hypothetical protein K2X27_08180, partial [Candidatus Obscuribacterales bacterium]|nr:hypothetical protein [Candidatus Obscuribacterales bacterium]